MKALTPLLLTLLCSACFNLKEQVSKNKQTPNVVVIDSTLFNDTTLLMTASVRHLYRLANFSPLWSDTAGFTKKADSLIAFVENSANRGLIPAHYHSETILAELLKPDDDARLMKVDVLLSDAFLAISNDLKHGRLDEMLHFVDRRTLIDSAAIQFLINGMTTGSMEAWMRKSLPEAEAYLHLADSLTRLLREPAHDSLVTRRIHQLIVNLERCYTMVHPPARYIDVNIPAFRLQVREGDSVVLESRVIVGKKTTPTPELQSTITSFLIYPYWHVPRSIATGEILPMVKQDSAYLTKHHYEVLDPGGAVVDPLSINWAELDVNNFPYIFRQREGRENALGVIKFSFENPYGVYLHDTNGPRLFSRDIRAMSHGCVRVQKARELARHLVSDDSVYVTPDDLEQYFALRQRLRIKVPSPIALVIRYNTVDWDGNRLNFYDDIYGRDEEMLARLSTPRNVSHRALTLP